MEPKIKTDKLNFIKTKSFGASEDTLRNRKDEPQNMGKYLQIICLIKI